MIGHNNGGMGVSVLDNFPKNSKPIQFSNKIWLLITAIDVVFHCHICHGKNKAVEDKFDILFHEEL